MLNMRFEGTDTALMVLCEEGENENFDTAFKRSYQNEFGFLLETNILVDDIKVGVVPLVLTPFELPRTQIWCSIATLQVRGIGKTFDTLGPSVFSELASLSPPPRPAPSSKIDSQYSVFFEGVGRVNDTPVYLLEKLDVGDKVEGPAMIVDGTQTIVVVPGAEVVAMTRHLVIYVDIDETLRE